MRLPAVDTHERVREAAFALLLKERRPIMTAELAEASGVADLAPVLDSLSGAGWIDRMDGAITGSAGLSLSDGPHRLRFGLTAFQTWCAYDALGIPAALGSDADIATVCGLCGAAIAVRMLAGVPDRSGPELLWLADGSDDLRTSFCTPTVLLCGAEHGEAWAQQHQQAGQLLDLVEAAARGAKAWASCAEVARRLSERTDVEYVGGPRDSQRETRTDVPHTIAGPTGAYRRSLRCADDGAVRYVWDEH